MLRSSNSALLRSIFKSGQPNLKLYRALQKLKSENVNFIRNRFLLVFSSFSFTHEKKNKVEFLRVFPSGGTYEEYFTGSPAAAWIYNIPFKIYTGARGSCGFILSSRFRSIYSFRVCTRREFSHTPCAPPSVLFRLVLLFFATLASLITKFFHQESHFL